MKLRGCNFEALAGFFLGIAFFLACAIGWITNIVMVFNHDGSILDGEFILRVAGIFVAPIGVILGYL